MSQENKEVIVKYSSYTPAQKRATYKWNSQHMDKVRANRVRYYYREKERNQALSDLAHLLEAVKYREYVRPRPRGRPRKGE